MFQRRPCAKHFLKFSSAIGTQRLDDQTRGTGYSIAQLATGAVFKSGHSNSLSDPRLPKRAQAA